MGDDLMPQGAHEALFDALASLDAYISIDDVGTIVQWNAAAEQLFGWSAEEAIGLPLVNLIIPDRYRDAHAAGLARLRDSGQGEIIGRRIELEGLRRNRTEVSIELLVVASGNDSCAYSAFIRDLSRRRELEAAQALAQLGVFSIDLRKDELSVSDEMRRIVGLEADELLPPLIESVHRFIYPDDREGVLTVVQRAGEIDAPIHVRFRVQRGSGVRVVSVFATVDRDSSGEPLRLWGTAQDVTDLRAKARTAPPSWHA